MNEQVWADILESMDQLVKNQAELIAKMSKIIDLAEVLVVQEELRSFDAFPTLGEPTPEHERQRLYGNPESQTLTGLEAWKP